MLSLPTRSLEDVIATLYDLARLLNSRADIQPAPSREALEVLCSLCEQHRGNAEICSRSVCCFFGILHHFPRVARDAIDAGCVTLFARALCLRNNNNNKSSFLHSVCSTLVTFALMKRDAVADKVHVAVVLNTMEFFARDVHFVNAGSKLLAACSYNVKFCEKLGAHNAKEALLDYAVAHDYNEEILKHAVIATVNVLKNCATASRDLSGIVAACGQLQKHNVLARFKLVSSLAFSVPVEWHAAGGLKQYLELLSECVMSPPAAECVCQIADAVTSACEVETDHACALADVLCTLAPHWVVEKSAALHGARALLRLPAQPNTVKVLAALLRRHEECAVMACDALLRVACAGHATLVSSVHVEVLRLLESSNDAAAVLSGLALTSAIYTAKSDTVLLRPEVAASATLAMLAHAKNAEVVAQCCALLLTVPTDIMVATPVLLQAMREHKDNPRVQQQSLAVLFKCMLAHEHDISVTVLQGMVASLKVYAGCTNSAAQYISMLTRVQPEKLQQCGAAATALQFLRHEVYGNCANVVASAMQLLAVCMSRDAHSLELKHSVPLLLHRLRGNLDSYSTAYACVALLRAAAFTRDGAQSVADEEGVFVLVDVLKRYRSCANMVKRCCEALARTAKVSIGRLDVYETLKFFAVLLRRKPEYELCVRYVVECACGAEDASAFVETVLRARTRDHVRVRRRILRPRRTRTRVSIRTSP